MNNQFKPGDKVTLKSEDELLSLQNCLYCEEMSSSIGEIGIIDDYDETDNTYIVVFESAGDWWCDENMLVGV